MPPRAAWSRHKSHSSLKTPTVRTATEDYDVSLGSRKFGKATIDCRFLAESKWGLLRQKPAALLFLDLAFDQPDGYKMSNVTVELSFFERDATATPAASTVNLPSVIKYIAPTMICGPPVEQRGSRENSA